MNRLLSGLILLFISTTIFSASIQGNITDGKSNEQLIGAVIYINELQIGTSSDLLGFYIIKNIPEGAYTITTKFIGYKSVEKKIVINQTDLIALDFALLQSEIEMEEVSVITQADKSSDNSARSSEKNADQLINIVSAKTIELSPDLNVANVIQRMSGVTLDKSSSSGGQYALLRGMDKRYNYTLVNGIKIPSAHNNHRYISLDMFPSDMVDRIEVTKALTPNMEGDAIAGVINLVMKNASDKATLSINGSSGYNQFFANNNFSTFNPEVLNDKSPYERNEKGYRAVTSDFSTNNLKIGTNNFPINSFGNLTAGNRFFKKRLGWIFSGSYQNSFNGSNSLLFKDDLSRDGKNLPILSSMQDRIYTDKKRNIGIHNKLDYFITKRKDHSLQLYTAYIDFDNEQVREVENTDLAVSYDPENGNINRKHSTRLRYNKQSLLTTTLQGNHKISKRLSVQWSAVYSKANNETPEESTITYGTNLENFLPVRQYVDFDGSTRIWRRNSDKDKAAYLNLTYKTTLFGKKLELLAGGLYREKERSSFYNKYTLNAIVKVSNPDTSYTSFYSEKGVDWNTYDEINWQVYNPRGTVAVGENYDAYETVKAGYAMFRYDYSKLHVTGGIRIENTEQGYDMLYPIGEPQPTGNQKYNIALPSIHFKYSPVQKQNIRLSYYKAINKPGFQEIVPYLDATEEPVNAGNKNLKHAVADNLDLRWEYFPAALDQILIGTFYKKIKDPIEFAFDKFLNISQQIVYTPINSAKAINYGIEIDLIKYYRQFGIKGNYTLTRSNISTQKLSRVKNANGNDSTAYIDQARPLFGQASHVGNISFLYKGLKNGISAQMAFSYTGNRIYTISRYIENDLWQKGFWQLDLSAEKKFNKNLSLFIKAQNILNSHVKVYIKKTNPINNDVIHHNENDANTIVRDEYSMQSYLIGIRFKLL